MVGLFAEWQPRYAEHRVATFPVAIKGKDKCKFHGGKTPVKHGLYSKFSKTRLSDLVSEMVHDKRILDLREHLSLQVALIADFISRVEGSERCEHCGNLTLTPETIESLSTLVEKAGKTAERFHRVTIQNRMVLNVEEFMVLIRQVATLVGRYVTNERERVKLAGELEGLFLPNTRVVS